MGGHDSSWVRVARYEEVGIGNRLSEFGLSAGLHLGHACYALCKMGKVYLLPSASPPPDEGQCSLAAGRGTVFAPTTYRSELAYLQ